MLERWTRAVIRRRVVVITCWAVVVIIGLFSSARLTSLLSSSLVVPGTGSQQANAILARQFGENVEGTFTVVLRGPKTSGISVSALNRALAVAAGSVPSARASTLRRGVGILYGDIATPFDLQRAASYTAPLRNALRREGLTEAYVTGAPALQHDLAPVLGSDLRVGEVTAVLAALALLTFALGMSVAVLLPLVIALCTTSAALGVVYILAHEFLMVLYVPNLVQLIGLGLAVDYSLLALHRFREELEDSSRPVDEAIVRTVATAGRTVRLSGLAVASGLSALLLIPVPFVRSLGIAVVVVPLVAVAAALTLQPAVLSLLGRPGMRAARPPRLLRGDRDRLLWPRLARGVIRHPVIVLAGTTCVLLMAAIPTAWLQLTPASVTAIPQNTQSARGLALLRERVGPGFITPVEVVIGSGTGGGLLAAPVAAATMRLAREVLEQPDVFLVAIGSRWPYVDPTGRYRRAIVVERDDFGGEASQRFVRELRLQLVPAARFPAGTRVFVGGAPAQGVDFLARVYGRFVWVVLLAAGVVYVLLVRAFRSLLLPLMALGLDALSVAAACGLVVALFRFGAGADILGLYRVSQVEGWVPLFLFAMLFGLSMDYQVFFVTRMRESWDQGADNERAIVDGLSRTGRVVTAAALIMVVALSGLVTGRVAGLQEIGAGLALGVVIDATLVRGLLMPSLMVLAGRWNWWLPAPVAGVMHVEASPLAGGRRRGSLEEHVDGAYVPRAPTL